MKPILKRRRRGHLPGGAWTVFILAFTVYAATGTYGGNQSVDTFTAHYAAWALAVHHTVNLGSIGLTRQFAPGLWLVPGAHGSLVSNRFPGAVLLAAPLYALAGGGLSPVPGTLTAALAAAGTCALLYKVLRRLQMPRVTTVATLLFMFATANWTVSGRELWQHPGAELVIAAGMLATLSQRYTVAGLAFGAAVMFRPHLGIGAAAMALGAGWLERRWRPTIELALGVVPGVLAYLAWNFMVYGRLTALGGYSDQIHGAGGMGPLGFLENIAGTFASPERGVLICSPILLVSALGLRSAWRSSPKVERVFAVAGLAYLASQLWLIRFSGGNGFIGYRVCLETLLWSAPLLVRAGMIGARRIPAVVMWLMAAVSVSFYAAGAFVQGEINGGADPWTSWAPLQIADQYGPGRAILGALLGLGGVLVAWYFLEGKAGREAKSALGLNVSSAVSEREAALHVQEGET